MVLLLELFRKILIRMAAHACSEDVGSDATEQISIL